METEIKYSITLVFLGVVIGVLIMNIVADTHILQQNNSSKFNESEINEESVNELIHFETEISEEDKTEINRLINSINPIYLINVKNITFLNKTSLQEEYSGEESISGLHKNGYIYLLPPQYLLPQYNENLKKTTCHEILHSLITEIPKDEEEKIVQDLAAYYPCYIKVLEERG